MQNVNFATKIVIRKRDAELVLNVTRKGEGHIVRSCPKALTSKKPEKPIVDHFACIFEKQHLEFDSLDRRRLYNSFN